MRVVQAAPRSSSATIRAPSQAARMRSRLVGEELRDGLPAVARRGLELDELERELARQALRVVGDGRRSTHAGIRWPSATIRRCIAPARPVDAQAAVGGLAARTGCGGVHSSSRL